jgi:arylsulfatase A-like enzyme
MSSPANSQRPNVLFIITDDHQADALGAAGHPEVQTPGLDALAKRGVRFTQATNMGSLMPAICSPARACQLTGMHPFRANTDPRPGGGNKDFVTIPADLPTVPQLLGDAGYETFLTGKWHNDRASLLRSFGRAEKVFMGGMCDHRAVPVTNREGVERGEASVIGAGFSTELFCDAMVDFLGSRDESRPFFGWLSLTSPHDPRTPPSVYRDKYDAASLTLPSNYATEPKFDNGELDVRDEKLASKPFEEAEIREHLAEYYGMISHQDDQIGRVLAALKASGEEENTIVVYIGDHGLAMGQHGLLGKQNLYQHSIGVPLIVAGPGMNEGAVADGLVYTLDITATLLELAGVPAPAGLTSRSLGPQLRDASAGGRDELCSLYKNCQRMVRDARWKLIEYRVGEMRRTELFDLQADPAELDNVASVPENQTLVHSLRERLVAWQQSSGDCWMSLDLPIQPQAT